MLSQENCWKRSSRRCEGQLTHNLDSCSQSLLTSNSVLGILPTLLIATVIFKDAPREQCVFETTWIGYVTEHHDDLCYKCLRLGRGVLPLVHPGQAPVCTFPCLLNLLPTHLERPASSFASPCVYM